LNGLTACTDVPFKAHWAKNLGLASFVHNKTTAASAAHAADAGHCVADLAAFLAIAVRWAVGAAVLVVAHASCRPVEVASLASSIVTDLKGVKTREDLKNAAKDAMDQAKRMLMQKPDPQAFTFFNVRGAGVGGVPPNDASPGGPPQQQPVRKRLPGE
jgi:hypothetical protein